MPSLQDCLCSSLPRAPNNFLSDACPEPWITAGQRLLLGAKWLQLCWFKVCKGREPGDHYICWIPRTYQEEPARSKEVRKLECPGVRAFWCVPSSPNWDKPEEAPSVLFLAQQERSKRQDMDHIVEGYSGLQLQWWEQASTLRKDTRQNPERRSWKNITI
jgi:hypothetical protein